jgi:hypothetical protein
LINLKKKKQTKNQSQQWKIDRLAKIKLSQTTKKANTIQLQAKRNAITRKPIIITKNELKNSIFHFDCGTLFV